MNKELEKLKHEQYVAEQKLTAAKHKEKYLEQEMKRLTFLFHSEAAQKELNLLIEKRKKTLENEVAGQTRAQLYTA